jgi:hypothetical protein
LQQPIRRRVRKNRLLPDKKDAGRGLINFVIAVWRAKGTQSAAVKHWEIIADNLKRAGWSLGCLSAVDREGRTIWVVDAHRDDGQRFVVHADEKVTAMLELERAICLHLLSEQILEK